MEVSCWLLCRHEPVFVVLCQHKRANVCVHVAVHICVRVRETPLLSPSFSSHTSCFFDISAGSRRPNRLFSSFRPFSFYPLFFSFIQPVFVVVEGDHQGLRSCTRAPGFCFNGDFSVRELGTNEKRGNLIRNTHLLYVDFCITENRFSLVLTV